MKKNEIPNKPNPQSMDEIKKLIREQLRPGSKNHDLLIEGIENIKSRIEYNNRLKEAGEIYLDVNEMGGWVHNLVRDTLGGQIDSSKLLIKWEIGDKIVEYNPNTGKVEYAS